MSILKPVQSKNLGHQCEAAKPCQQTDHKIKLKLERKSLSLFTTERKQASSGVKKKPSSRIFYFYWSDYEFNMFKLEDHKSSKKHPFDFGLSIFNLTRS